MTNRDQTSIQSTLFFFHYWKVTSCKNPHPSFDCGSWISSPSLSVPVGYPVLGWELSEESIFPRIWGLMIAIPHHLHIDYPLQPPFSFFFLATLWGLWDLSFSTKGWTGAFGRKHRAPTTGPARNSLLKLSSLWLGSGNCLLFQSSEPYFILISMISTPPFFF